MGLGEVPVASGSRNPARSGFVRAGTDVMEHAEHFVAVHCAARAVGLPPVVNTAIPGSA